MDRACRISNIANYSKYKKNMLNSTYTHLPLSLTSPDKHIRILKLLCQIQLFGQVLCNPEILIWKFHQQTNRNMILHIGKVKKTSVI